MTDDSIDRIRNPEHVDASLSMNDRDTIISNMLKAATVENERLRAALNNIIDAVDDNDMIAIVAYAKTALASEQKENDRTRQR